MRPHGTCGPTWRLVFTRRFLAELRERFARFGLELHPVKTRLIELGQAPIPFREGRRFREQGTPILDLDVSVDGEKVVVGSEGGKVELWSLLETSRIWLTDDHNQETLNSVRFSTRGDLIVSAGAEDHRALVHDARGRIPAVLKHSSDVLSAEFSRNDWHILTNSSDGTAKLWSRDGKLKAEVRTPSSLNRALLSHDLRFVVTASSDGKVRLWERS